MQSSGLLSDGPVISPAAYAYRSLDFRQIPPLLEPKSWLSGGILKVRHAFGLQSVGVRTQGSRLKIWTTKSCMNSSEDIKRVAPLQLESSVGQFLSQILQNHPHLLTAAVDQQLERLQEDRDAQAKDSVAATDVLYKRIAEVKAKEMQASLEEIIYALVVHRFMDANISLIPTISPSSDPLGKVDIWPYQEQKLMSIHSMEAYEMIESHLSLVLGGSQFPDPLDSVVQISKLRVGKLYAASIMYGYFLKRVDERFQLEQSVETLPKHIEEESMPSENGLPNDEIWDVTSWFQASIGDDYEGYHGTSDPNEVKNAYKLRSYVTHLDGDTLQRYATIRSKAAVSIIEKQTQALFGRPDIKIAEDGTLDTSNDELIGLTFAGLTNLVLEAVAFGSYLWQVESYVDSRYSFVNR
ncbi:UV-B-induced protein [Nymphaea thermarum]|nr:UV-B-induced protein [Nymphaea thermarum]